MAISLIHGSHTAPAHSLVIIREWRTATCAKTVPVCSDIIGRAENIRRNGKYRSRKRRPIINSTVSPLANICSCTDRNAARWFDICCALFEMGYYSRRHAIGFVFLRIHTCVMRSYIFRPFPATSLARCRSSQRYFIAVTRVRSASVLLLLATRKL